MTAPWRGTAPGRCGVGALRAAAGVAVAAVLLGVGLAAAAPRALAVDTEADEAALLGLVNAARASRGRAPLLVHPALDGAALDHSREMLDRAYFSHDSASGVSYATRVRRAGYTRSGWSYWSVSEVIAWGAGSGGSPRAVFRAWMKSSSHRALIFGRRWRDVGIGCAYGRFRGISGVYVYTVDLGRRIR